MGLHNIRLVVNLCRSGMTTADEFAWVGVTALSASRAFLRAGFNVAIDVAIGSCELTELESICLVSPVKEYDAPLDIQGLSSTLCFAGFFRGAGFMNWGLASGSRVKPHLGTVMHDITLSSLVLPMVYTDPNETVHLISNKIYTEAEAAKELPRIQLLQGHTDFKSTSEFAA